MMKASKKSPTAPVTIANLQEFANMIIGTTEEMFKERDKRLDGHDNNQKRLLENDLVIIEELKAMREELATSTYRQANHSDQIENHENRIGILEKRVALSF